jgi:Family of unknown function (DUF6221)
VTDLVAFLSARLDEDEAAAVKAREGPRSQFVEADADIEPLLFDEAGEFSLPARVLREVEAKRAILTEHSPGNPALDPEQFERPTCGVCHAGGWDWDPENWPCPTVRAIAAVYRDHPDYDPAWVTASG